METMYSTPPAPPTSNKPKNSQNPLTPKKFLFYAFIFGVSFFLLNPVFNSKTEKAVNKPPYREYLISTIHFGSINYADNVSTKRVEKLQKLFQEINNLGSTEKEKLYTNDDLIFITRVITEPGFLIDLENLGKAFGLLDRLPGEVADKIRERIKEDVLKPKLIGDKNAENQRIDLDVDLNELDLTVRAYNVLMVNGITTLRQLVEATSVTGWGHEFYKWRNMGRATIVQIQEALQWRGLNPAEPY